MKVVQILLSGVLTFSILTGSFIANSTSHASAQEPKKRILNITSNENPDLRSDRMVVNNASLTELTASKIQEYDAIIIPFTNAKDFKNELKTAFQSGKYVLVVNPNGQLNTHLIKNALELDIATSEFKEGKFKTTAVGIYKGKTTNVLHTYGTEPNTTSLPKQNEIEQIIEKDIKAGTEPSSPSGSVSIMATPSSWSVSNEVWVPQGKLYWSRYWKPDRVNDNTKTVWTVHHYATTQPGDYLNTQGDTRFTSGWYFDYMYLRTALCDACNAEKVESSSPQNVGTSTTAQVSLGYGTVSYSWSWQNPGMKIENLSVLPNYARWLMTNSSYDSRWKQFQHEPGAMMSNTSGAFVADVSAQIRWNSTYWYNDMYTGIIQDAIPDF